MSGADVDAVAVSCVDCDAEFECIDESLDEEYVVLEGVDRWGDGVDESGVESASAFFGKVEAYGVGGVDQAGLEWCGQFQVFLQCGVGRAIVGESVEFVPEVVGDEVADLEFAGDDLLNGQECFLVLWTAPQSPQGHPVLTGGSWFDGCGCGGETWRWCRVFLRVSGRAVVLGAAGQDGGFAIGRPCDFGNPMCRRFGPERIRSERVPRRTQAGSYR